MTTSILAFLAALAFGSASAAPTPAPVDLGSKTSGIGNTDPVAQPSPDRVVDPLAPDAQASPQPDTPGKTGLGVTDRVPLGHPQNAPGSKTDGIGSPPAAGVGAH